MSLEAIRELSDEAAAQAAKKKLLPYVPHNAKEIEGYTSFPFPFLGDYVPPGWTKTDEEWFVDSSGFGQESEPALTVVAFKKVLAEYVHDFPGRGFGITSAGQFQVYVAAYALATE
jgi:hypothetical protein